jgi:hypothetical protein
MHAAISRRARRRWASLHGRAQGRAERAAPAAISGATHPVAGVVSLDAPIRLEGVAPAVWSLRDRFGETWAALRAGWHLERLPASARALQRPAHEPPRQLVLDHQASGRRAATSRTSPTPPGS